MHDRDPERSDWLIKVIGPVATTYATVALSIEEVEALARVVNAVAAAAVDSHRPSVAMKPLSQAGTRERQQLRHNNIDRIVAAAAREGRHRLRAELDNELRYA